MKLSGDEYIDGEKVTPIWSVENDPLFDNSDAGAILYKDSDGQHYLRVVAWGGGEHVVRITADEATRILAINDYRRVFWTYLGGQRDAERRGDREQANRLEAEMHSHLEMRTDPFWDDIDD